MLARLETLHPFRTPDARRLAVLFAVVYFAQGMWYLPNQTLTIVLKERGLSAGQVAAFFTISTIPWLIKPIYGLLSDFVPFFGLRRKSYLLLTSALAAAAGFILGVAVPHTYWWLAGLFTLMALGLAFTDVLVDALMVENGKPRGLTGAFQAVQWGAIYTASILVGELGGYLAERRSLAGSFVLASAFPALCLVMTVLFVKEAPARADREVFRDTMAAVRAALGERDLWVVAGFIFFWTFSPSFGPALLYYQTDVLRFSQQFIGHLSALGSIAAVGGAFVYAPLSRKVPLRRLINLSIGIGVVSTLAYLMYRGTWSALVIDTIFGGVGMITQLAFLDLAAKSCPSRVEATFFALLMSVFNGGAQGSQVVGGYLYDWLGYTPLVLISSAFTALAWLLVPLVKIDRIEAQARHSASDALGGEQRLPE
ncbi:MAG TPA: MFS transporter [Candidatus Methylomirabilis sp.]|nr:MFS transporter [Candidatus Methylomirabilis sp.]